MPCVIRTARRSSDDPVIRSLAGWPTPERGAALDRLTRATADFDAATIATTHQFCLSALAGLGVNADKDPGETFVEDISDLIDEVVDDLYVRKYARAHSDRLALAEARTIARAVVGEPQSELVAGPVDPGSLEDDTSGLRARGGPRGPRSGAGAGGWSRSTTSCCASRPR